MSNTVIRHYGTHRQNVPHLVTSHRCRTTLDRSLVTCPTCVSATKTSCLCFWTPEETWLSAASCGYGGGYEPGSQMEWNPDCPAHPPTPAAALASQHPDVAEGQS
jgi:hypothetical protein